MAQVYAVISAVGADRVGIVDDLSGIVAEAGGNIEESKMAVLGGEFAVIMLVSMEAKALDSLVAGTAGIEASLGLKFGVKPTRPAIAPGQGRPYSLETVSLDGKGIVHTVSAVLRKHGINIRASDETVAKIMDLVTSRPDTKFIVNLDNQLFSTDDKSINENFQINAFKKECMLKGYDSIDYLINLRDKVERYESSKIGE